MKPKKSIIFGVFMALFCFLILSGCKNNTTTTDTTLPTTETPTEVTTKPTEAPTVAPTEPTETPTEEPTTEVTTKGTYDMSNVSFSDSTITYDTKAHSLAITGNLPEGVSVSYTGNDKTNVGEYTITASFTGDENHFDIPSITATLTITKATYDTTGLSFNDLEVTYDGTEHTISVDGVPSGVTVIYVDADGNLFTSFVNAGVYDILATFTVDENNYNTISSALGATLTIKKATYDTSELSFNDKEVDYNGNEQTITVDNLPDGVSVKYTNSLNEPLSCINAGEYIIAASFTVDANHNDIESMSATLTIAKAYYDMSLIKFEDTTFTYDGKSHSIEIEGTLPEGTIITYNNNENHIDVGSYLVIASFTNDNYYFANTLSASVYIEHATYDMSSISFSDLDVTYDGESHGITISGDLPEGVTVSYIGDEGTDVGVYNFEAHFSGSSNYNSIQAMGATLYINKKTYTDITFNSLEVTYDEKLHTIGVEEALEGYTIKYYDGIGYLFSGATDAGIYNIMATFTPNSNNYGYISNMSATLTINPIKLTDETIKSQSATYDGTDKVITVTTSGYLNETDKAKAAIAYSSKENTVESIERINAGEYTVYYTLTCPNYETLTGSVTLVINKAVLNDGTVTKQGATYNTLQQYPYFSFYPLGGEKVDYTNLYFKDGDEYKDYTLFDMTSIGERQITYKAEFMNYEDVIGELSYNITKFTLNDNTLKIQSTAYNGLAQNIAIKLAGFKGDDNLSVGTITYSTDDVTYSSSVSLLDAGTYTIYYKVTFYGYNDVSGSVSYTINNGTPRDKTKSTQTFNYTGSSPAPEVSYEAMNGIQSSLGFSIDNVTYKSTLSITEIGTYTVYYKVTFTANYDDLTGSFTLIIEKEKLKTPVLSYAVLDGSVSWDADSNASSYVILLDGVETTVTEVGWKISPAICHKIQVKSVSSSSDYNDSLYSEPYYTLGYANNFKLNNNYILTWDEVTYATAYTITYFDYSITVSGLTYDIRDALPNTLSLEHNQICIMPIVEGGAYYAYSASALYSKVTSFTVQSSVTSVADSLFADFIYVMEVYNLSSLDITAGSSTNPGDIGKYAKVVHTKATDESIITNETEYDYMLYDNTYTYLIYKGSSASYTPPEDLCGESYTIFGYAFKSNTALTTVVVPNGVNKIEEGAFNGCSSLVSMTLPFVGSERGNTGVKESLFGYIFGGTSYTGAITHSSSYSASLSYTFNSPSTLTTVIITDETVIGYGAFHWIEGLTSITFNDGITSIGEKAFSHCTGLTSIVIPSSVTSIGALAFEGDSSYFKSITLPFVGSDRNGTKSSKFYYIFGTAATSVPSSLTTVTLTEGTIIKTGSFTGCTNIVTLNLPSTLITIERESINNCSSIVSIVIPEGVKTIDYRAFDSCTKLESINIPTSVELIGSGCFDYTSMIYDTSIKGLLYLGNWVIDCTLTTYSTYTFKDGTVGFGGGAFYSNTSVTSLTIPDSVKYLGTNAFSYCTKLKSITLSPNITSILDSCFYGCTALTSLTIPEGVTKIEMRAFDDCTALQTLELPDSLQSIGDFIIYKDTSLTSLVIPKNVSSISNQALIGSSLTSLVVSEDNKTFDSRSGCNAIIETSTNTLIASCPTTTIPEGVVALGKFSFAYSPITTIVFPSTLTSFNPNSAFYKCSNIQYLSVASGNTVFDCRDDCNAIIKTATNTIVLGSINTVIPSTVVAIGDYAFSGNTSLKEIVIPSSVTSIGNQAFYGCTGLTEINIPGSVTTIGNTAFYNCTGVKTITLNEGTTIIDQATFSSCTSLESIVIPVSLTSVKYASFNNCSKLTTVYYKGTAEEWTTLKINGTGNTTLTAATIYYYSSTQPTETGNYWYYDTEGVVTIWS